MAIADNISTTIANATTLGGAQDKPKVVELANGRFVVAWNHSIPGASGGTDIRFQIFNADGSAIGSLKTASAQAGNEEQLQDIIANADGSFTIAYTATGLTPATAPAGYGALGALTQIGVVRSFNAAGTALGVETVLGDPAGQEVVNSIKLVFEDANSINAYFTQKDASTNATDLRVVSQILTSGVASGVASLVKDFDGAPNAVPANVMTLNQVVRLSANSDSILTNDRWIFSDSPADERAMPGTQAIHKVQNGFYLAFTPLSEEVQVQGFSGLGSDPAIFVLGNGSVSTNIASLNNNGTASRVQVDDLGGGRLMVSWFASPVGIFSGVFGQVFDTASLTFEGVAKKLLETPQSSFGTAVLADGRFAVTGASSGGLAGFDTIFKVFDASDSSFGATNIGDNNSSTPDGDAVSFISSVTGIRIDLQNGALNTGAAIAFAGQDFDHVLGGAGADQIDGDSFQNILKGAGGNDIIRGRAGNDILDGQDGDDFIDGGDSGDLIDGGEGLDTLHGGAGFDTIHGGGGNDAIQGGAEGDQIFGGLGLDFVIGGAGDDVINGDGDGDSLRGGDGLDTILGGDGNDAISGGAGDDLIDGGEGNDIINGGGGANTINGGNGVDTISYAGGPTAGAFGVFIDLEGTATAEYLGSFDPPADVIQNVERAVATDGQDFIFGSAVANVMRGLNGTDTLFGRGGADTLFGGGDADRFRYEAVNQGGDQIKDFAQGSDTIEILSFAFGEINGGNIASRFVANATGAATLALAQFTLDNAGAGAGTLRFDADGTGAGAANIVATITFDSAAGLGAFGAGDFEFF